MRSRVNLNKHRGRVCPEEELWQNVKFCLIQNSDRNPSQVHEPRHGRRQESIAEKIVYGALDIVSERSGSDPLEVFEAALEASLRWWK